MPSIGTQQLIFGFLFLVLAWYVARALVRGVWQSGEASYDRHDQPVEYWFSLLFHIAMLPMVGWLILAGDDKRTTLAWHIAFPLLVGVPTTFWLIRALQTGSAGPSGMTAQRREEPGLFWLLILGHVAVIGLVGGVLTWRGVEEPGPRTFYDEVGPVLAAVRAQMPGRTPGEFYNVRVDSTSRLICGEVRRPDGRRLRFFGAGPDDSARATLESDALPRFGASYARLCGGPPILP